MRKLGTALAAAVLLVTSACGGDSARPSQDELSKALTRGGQDSILGPDAAEVSKKGADCIAKVLVDSKISDRGLRAIAEGNRSFAPTRADAAYAAALKPEIVKCLPAGIS